MKEIIPTLQAWTAAGFASAEAILVSAQHSSPRQPGARLVVNERGELAGAVSMGCVESDLREHLLRLLRGESPEQIVAYGAAFEPALEVGLSCGGEIKVWLRKHHPDAAAWRGVVALSATARALLLTPLNPDTPQILLHPGDTPPVPAMQPILADLLRRGANGKFTLEGTTWFAEAIAPEPLLLIVGASPIAVELCAMAARSGFRVAVVDPRRDFARAELFPAAEKVVHQWPEAGLPAAGMDEASYVAVLAHDAKLDVPALSAALRARCHYIGLLGSSRTRASRHAELQAAGFSAADIARIRGPIGLKTMGAVEPPEIAVSILAQLIMARRGTLPPAVAEEPT